MVKVLYGIEFTQMEIRMLKYMTSELINLCRDNPGW